MASLKSSEIRGMSRDERRAKLREIRDELLHERGIAAMGGAPASPGKIRALRANIARLMTIDNELRKKELAKQGLVKRGKQGMKRKGHMNGAGSDARTGSKGGKD